MADQKPKTPDDGAAPGIPPAATRAGGTPPAAPRQAASSDAPSSSGPPASPPPADPGVPPADAPAEPAPSGADAGEQPLDSSADIAQAGLMIDVPFEGAQPAPQKLQYGGDGDGEEWTPPPGFEEAFRKALAETQKWKDDGPEQEPASGEAA